MNSSDLHHFERRIGPLPRDYREFLASYPDSFRRPAIARLPSGVAVAPLSTRVPDDVNRLLQLNEAPRTARFRVRGFIVVGQNGVGDPYLVRQSGEPGVFLGNHETGGSDVVQQDGTLARFVASLEATTLERLRDECTEEGDVEAALRLADAAVSAWKRYGKGKQATQASRTRSSLRLLTDPKTNDAALRSILAADPAKAAAALGTAANVAPALADAILDAEMFPRFRAVGYANAWRALARPELVPWAKRRSARRTSPAELFWLDWSLQKAGIDRKTRDELFAWLPVPPSGCFEDIDTGDGRVSHWVDLPLEPDVAYPFGDDHAYQERSAVAFTAAFRMTRTLITESEYAPFRDAFAEVREPGSAIGPREPARVGLPDAIAYGRWLEVRGGLAGARLPTEEEWEVACRGGTWWNDAWPDDVADVAWVRGLAWNARVAVARKSANPWGLYDMIGLDSQWTLSEYAGHAVDPLPRRPPQTFDPAAVPCVPVHRPRFPMVCGGKFFTDEALRDPQTPASRNGLGLDSTSAFRLVAPCRDGISKG